MSTRWNAQRREWETLSDGELNSPRTISLEAWLAVRELVRVLDESSSIPGAATRYLSVLRREFNLEEPKG